MVGFGEYFGLVEVFVYQVGIYLVQYASQWRGLILIKVSIVITKIFLISILLIIINLGVIVQAPIDNLRMVFQS